MTRSKVTLAYLTNDADRKASYKKRKRGLIKKVDELSTLCGIKACAIVYGEGEQEPEVWPNQEGAREVLEQFLGLSEVDRSRKMVNQEGFSQSCIDKATAQYERLERENRRKELELFMYQVIAGERSFQDFDMSCAAEMSSVVKQIRGEIKARIEVLQRNGGESSMVPNDVDPATNEVAPEDGNKWP